VVVSEHSEHSFYTDVLEEGTASGLFVATHVPLRIGRRLEFFVTLDDDGPPFAGIGVVKWIRPYSETSDAPPGMGIEFHELPIGAFARITAFLRRRPPLLHDATITPNP
jgi:Tfp pilus assembly protein PilZ